MTKHAFSITRAYAERDIATTTWTEREWLRLVKKFFRDDELVAYDGASVSVETKSAIDKAADAETLINDLCRHGLRLNGLDGRGSLRVPADKAELFLTSLLKPFAQLAARELRHGTSGKAGESESSLLAAQDDDLPEHLGILEGAVYDDDVLLDGFADQLEHDDVRVQLLRSRFANAFDGIPSVNAKQQDLLAKARRVVDDLVTASFPEEECAVPQLTLWAAEFISNAFKGLGHETEEGDVHEYVAKLMELAGIGERRTNNSSRKARVKKALRRASKDDAKNSKDGSPSR